MNDKDKTALYECLSIPFSSDSEISCDDAMYLKHAYEVIVETESNVEGDVKNNCQDDEAFEKTRLREKNDTCELLGDVGQISPAVKGRKRISERLKIKQSIWKQMPKQVSVFSEVREQSFSSGVHYTELKVAKRRKENYFSSSNMTSLEFTRDSDNVDPVKHRASSCTQKLESMREEDEETIQGYEASEDCNSDMELEKPLVPTRRTRTASGSSIALYACPHESCGKEFNRPKRLVEHKRTHTGEVSDFVDLGIDFVVS